MASMISRASFTVLAQADQLIVNQVVEGETRTLCILSLRDRYSFFMRDGKVVCLCSYGQSFVFDTVTIEDAHILLGLLAQAPLRHTVGLSLEGEQQQARPIPEDEPLKAKPKRALEVALLFGLASISFVAGVAFKSEMLTPAPVPSDKLSVLSSPRPEPNLLPTPGLVIDDGWALPAAIRATLPEKLHKAAERKLFTVDYSSGHARTLYVFSDPGCPNCQRLEPALNSLSDAFNVVVFPVPVIGKEKSVAAITPVLCRPPEQRKAAWDALFDPVPEGVSLRPVEKSENAEQPASEGVDSKAAHAGECEVAEKALGINQVAYQAYRIPGTPWAISDDGRYVSQALLRDPLKLQAFLDQPQPALSQGQEVSDAGQ